MIVEIALAALKERSMTDQGDNSLLLDRILMSRHNRILNIVLTKG
jgi:hypothetical protein